MMQIDTRLMEQVKAVLQQFDTKYMTKDGVDISHQKSKLIDLNYFNSADLIVTLCGDARDRCPVIPPQAQSIHWPLPDPAQAKGTPEQKMVVFRQVRDEIKQLVKGLI
jgi:arsenate reductase